MPSTIPLSQKGPAAPRPTLRGAAEKLAREIETWPGVTARAHWEIGDDTAVNGVDFYVGEQELGHIHLDGEAHVPVTAAHARTLIAAGRAHAFPWSKAWVTWEVAAAADVAIARDLFQFRFDRVATR